MSLFTSNSSSPQDESPRFLGLLFLLTLLILTIYSWAARQVVFTPFFPQSQFQDNQYKVEYLINQIHSIDPSQYSVIVGSSLGASLREEYLPPKILNLSFSGGSALTGLEFILKSHAHFKKVYVEATVLRVKDEAMLFAFAHPLELWRIEKLKVGNVDQQPVSIFSNFLRKRFAKGSETAFDQILFDQAMEWQLKNYATLKENEMRDFRAHLTALKELIAEIRKNKTEVVMVETPIDPKLLLLPGMSWYIQTLEAAFQDDPGISWIKADAGTHYQTTDGIHLTDEAAKIFAKKFD